MNILKEIRSYIKKNKIVSVKDLSNHFGMDKSSLDGLLIFLVRKKIIKKIECNSCKGNCSSCSLVNKDVYYKYISLKSIDKAFKKENL